jgi:predicted metalloprotease with PDZ domain
LDESRFLKHVAAEITELEERAAHATQTVEESSLDAWLEKYDYYRLPQRSISYYTKGELLGIVLDLAMREASDGKASLRDLFQWLNREYASQGRSFPDSEGIRQAVEAVTHADFASFFKMYVASTDEIAWDDYFNTVGLRVVKTTKAVADAGFEAAPNFSGPPSVLIVTPNSAAALAGLAVGDMILEIGGQPAGWDLSEKIEQMHAGDTLSVRVRGPSGERDLHWKLGSREQTEFELKDVDPITPRQRDRRVAWLKGESQSSGEAHP